MSTQRDFGIIPFIVSATVNAFRFVTLGSADTVAQSSAAGTIVGVAQDSAVYSSSLTTDVPVKLVGQHGTFKITASGAITAGARIYVDADGKATATANAGGAVAIANQAAAADGDIIEAIWLKPQLGDITGIGYTVLAADVTATFKDIDTGLASKPTFSIIQIRSVTGGLRVYTESWTGGVVRLTPTGITAGDLINVLYRA